MSDQKHAYPQTAINHEVAFEHLKHLLKQAGMSRRAFVSRLAALNSDYDYDERSISNWKKQGIPRKDGLLYTIVLLLVEHAPRDRCPPRDVLAFLAPAGFALVDIKGIAPFFDPVQFNEALRDYLPLFEHIDEHPPMPGRLPTYRTSFVGREAEQATLTTLLMQHHMLTIWGPGGCGKTRLAVQTANTVRSLFHHGCCFVDLTAIDDPSLLPVEIARVLGIQETAGHSLLAALNDYLRHRHGILILDNFEHIIDAAPILMDLLDASPMLHILATSREPLQLYGEQHYEIAPLRLPDPTQCPPDWSSHRDHLLQSEAIHLFLDRARNRKFDFALTPENASAITDICIALDGLPLIIELVASHVNTFTPHVIRDHIKRSLTLARATLRNLPERQRSAQASFDWSYNLLHAHERTLFHRLTVFVGSFSLAAAEAICNINDDLGDSIMPGIESLINKSLLRQKETFTSEPRFTMLETIRDYAHMHLRTSGETETIYRAHASWYLTLARDASAGLKGAQQEAWRCNLEEDHSNMRAAIQRMIELGDAEYAMHICDALELFWYWCGYQREGRYWLERILLSETLSLPARARALDEAGGLAWAQGDYEQARMQGEQSLDIWRTLDNAQGMLEALNTLGLTAESQGRLADAIALHEQGLALRREIGDPFRIAIALGNLGDAELYHQPHQPERAIARFDESLAIYHHLEDSRGIADMHVSLGDAALFQGNTAQAIAHFTHSFATYQHVANMNKQRIARLLERCAEALTRQGHATYAARLLGSADTLRVQYDVARPPISQPYYDQTSQTTRAALPPDTFAQLFAEGQAYTLDEAIAAVQSRPSSHTPEAPTPTAPPAHPTLYRWDETAIATWHSESITLPDTPAAYAATYAPAIDVDKDHPIEVILPSWKATTPPGTWIELHMRVLTARTWSRWYRMLAWDSATTQSHRQSFPRQDDAICTIEVETFSPTKAARAVQARIVHCRNQSTDHAHMHNLTLCLCPPAPRAEIQGPPSVNLSLPDTYQLPSPLPTPAYTQYRNGTGHDWCSPTALAMVLGYWYTQTGWDNLKPFTTPESIATHIVPAVNDPAYGTGNWSFNTAYAAWLGLEAYVTHLDSTYQLAAWLTAGVPLIASIAWKHTELENAPIPESDGHLVTIRGIASDGSVLVADPAGADTSQVLRSYRLDQFMACWHRHSAGAAYIIYPPGWDLPAIPHT